MTYDVVRVGIGILVYQGDLILLGKRKGAHGEGEWAFPGGKQEYGETVIEGAYREIAEEVGPEFKVKHMDLLCVGDLMRYKPKHFMDIGLCAEFVSGAPVVMEPDKCSEWRWFHIDRLPEHLFSSVQAYVDAFSGKGDMVWNDR